MRLDEHNEPIPGEAAPVVRVWPIPRLHPVLDQRWGYIRSTEPARPHSLPAITAERALAILCEENPGHTIDLSADPPADLAQGEPR